MRKITTILELIFFTYTVILPILLRRLNYKNTFYLAITLCRMLAFSFECSRVDNI